MPLRAMEYVEDYMPMQTQNWECQVSENRNYSSDDSSDDSTTEDTNDDTDSRLTLINTDDSKESDSKVGLIDEIISFAEVACNKSNNYQKPLYLLPLKNQRFQDGIVEKLRTNIMNYTPGKHPCLIIKEGQKKHLQAVVFQINVDEKFFGISIQTNYLPPSTKNKQLSLLPLIDPLVNGFKKKKYQGVRMYAPTTYRKTAKDLKKIGFIKEKDSTSYDYNSFIRLFDDKQED